MINILQDTAILLAPSYRSRAYAQGMIKAGLVPKTVIAMPGDEPLWSGEDNLSVQLNEGACVSFAPSVRALDTLQPYVPETVKSPIKDINSQEFIELIKNLEVETVIYSGFGGVLLKKPLLDAGKRFLHVHGGYAPQFRGSTAFYYSILKEGSLGATALWLVKEIDAGPILMRREYTPPFGVEIDRIVDPLVRADLLVAVLQKRLDSGRYDDGSVIHDDAETFHVIHPVLKHMALSQVGLVKAS